MMKLAYITEHNVLNSQKWSRHNQGTCTASRYIADNFAAQNTTINYIGSLVAKHKIITRSKWNFYRLLLQKDYYSWAEPLISRSYAKQIEKRILASKADIALCPQNIVPIAYLQIKQPLVLWTDATLTSLINFYHHMDNLCDENVRNIYKMEAAALNRCKLILYTSDWAAQSAIQTYGINPDKVKVVPWGANLECDRTAAEIDNIIQARPVSPCKLLFIGVDWIRKGGKVTLEIAKLLNESGLPTELTIVGCKPIFSQPIPHFVKVIEFIDKSQPKGIEKLNQLFREAHFLVLPSQADCTPHVFAEANSFGTPSIATNVGGIATLIQDDINGKTFALNADISEYTNYIQSMMTNYTTYQKLAQSSFEQYQTRLNWQVATNRAKQLIQDLI